MPTKKRTIVAYGGIFNFDTNNTLVQVWNGQLYLNALRYISQLPIEARVEETSSWFFCLDQLITRDGLAIARFKGARIGTRIPLIRRTLQERPNPKDIEEGERNITHIVARLNDGLILFERNYASPATPSRITQYIETHARVLLEQRNARNLIFEPLLDRRFLDGLGRFQRISLASVAVEVQGDRLGQNPATRTLHQAGQATHAQKAELQLVAPRTGSLLEAGLANFFQGILADEPRVLSARIKGKKVDGGDGELKLQGIEEKTIISAETNDQGDVLPDSVLQNIIDVAGVRDRIR